MASRIEDYGYIGNLRTGALVSKTGDIDWLCAPRFDSDACFASLIGYDEHGRWAVRPTQGLRETRQTYRGDTLILDTEFICEKGTVRITDFMPIAHDEDRSDVIRVIEGVTGEVDLEMLLDVRFGYGAYKPWITKDGEGLRFTAGPDAFSLRTPAALEQSGPRVASYMTVKKGQRIPLQLTWHPSHLETPGELDPAKELSKVEGFWKEWSGRCTYQGGFREAVMRSLITLKGMIYEPTGGIVAAPTTLFPEEIGGVRNWDYRFCWLRDASLTLDALMIGGYVEEAGAFRSWLLRAIAGAPDDIQIMYNILGGRRLTEYELDWLPGYEGSHPVRVGNAASGQFQLDVYGEVFSCLYAARRMGLPAAEEGWAPAIEVVEFIEKAWQKPDDGIWEVRGGRRHFTHSKIMAWVAIDRAIRTITEVGKEGGPAQKLLPHLTALRERIHQEVCERGWNPRVKAFTQYYGGDTLDASVLVMTHVGFLPAKDPRVVATVKAIEKTLLRDGFVLRYDTQHGTDGLPGTEGAFLACSFWLADNYAFAGRIDEAEKLYERLLGLRNHLGLLAEEYDPQRQRQIGNFPQAFSHLALIFTARVIDAMREGKDARSLTRGTGAPAIVHH